MTQNVDPNTKSGVDPVFQTQVTQQQQQAQQDYSTRSAQSQAPWLMPDLQGWSGDLFDYDSMAQAFSREEANNDYVQATSDDQNPGTSGDLIIATTQIDYLATMERAFRARHTYSWPRAYAQALGRRMGHGDESYGLYVYGILGYIKAILQESSGPPSSG